MNGVDNLASVNPLQVDRGDPKVRVPELALDDRQRDAFVGHLDRVRMPQLVRREPPPHPGLCSEASQLGAGGGR